MSLLEKALLGGFLALLLAGAAAVAVERIEQRGYQRAQVEAAEVARIQRDQNLELQRAAEKRYVVQADVRERFITQTITEIRHETGNLAACVLSDHAVQLLNDAAGCARGDRSATCAPDGGVSEAP